MSARGCFVDRSECFNSSGFCPENIHKGKKIKLGFELSGVGTAVLWDQPLDFIANFFQYRNEDGDSDVGYWEKLRTDIKEAYNDSRDYSTQYHWYKSPYGRAFRAGVSYGIMWFLMNQLPNPMRSERWARQQSFVVPGPSTKRW